MKSAMRAILLSGVVCLGWAGCGPGKPTGTLHEAAEKGDLIAVKQHIAARSNLDARDRNGWAAMHIAARRGDTKIVELLGAAGADPGRQGPNGQTPMEVARAAGRTAVVQLLQAKLKPVGGTTATGGAKQGRGLVDGGLGVSGAMDNM